MIIIHFRDARGQGKSLFVADNVCALVLGSRGGKHILAFYYCGSYSYADLSI
jgi:hypothetical protein